MCARCWATLRTFLPPLCLRCGLPLPSLHQGAASAECPACACGDISFLGPEKLREKFIGDEKEIDILCPMCGTKTKGKVEEEKK